MWLWELIEEAFHQTVRAERLYDFSAQTELRLELDWLEVFDIEWVEEHESADSLALVDLMEGLVK